MISKKVLLCLFFAGMNSKYLIFIEAKSGLPHTQGIQGNSGNFQVEENLRETQGILIYFFNSGKF